MRTLQSQAQGVSKTWDTQLGAICQSMLCTEKAESERRCGGPWAAAMSPCAARNPVDFVVLETHIAALSV